MSGRVIAESAVGILLTVVLSVLGAGLFQLADGEPPQLAFLSSGPRLIASTLWLPLIVWSAFIVAGNARNRHRSGTWAFATNLAISAACAVLTIVGWFAIALLMGGWALFLVAISLISCAIFLTSAVIAMVLTHLMLFRRPPSGIDVPLAVHGAAG